MLNSAINTLMFDLDNTLIDRNAAMQKTMRQWLVETGYGTQDVDIYLAEIMQKDDWGYMNRLDFSAWVLEHYAKEYMKKSDPNAFYDYTLKNIVQYLEPDEAVISMIERLGANYNVMIATNGKAAAQKAKLEQAGLYSLFEPENIFISGNLGVEKPDKRFFETITNDLKLNPAQALMVGDSPINDIQAAKNSNLNTCWVSYGRKNELNPVPDMVINRITDLQTYFH